MKKYIWTSDISRGGAFFTATPQPTIDCGYYCTNTNGDGLFYVTPYNRVQLVGTCDFTCKTLASFKYRLFKYLKRNDD